MAGFFQYRQEEHSKRWHIVPDETIRGCTMRFALCGHDTWHGCNAGSMRRERHDPPGTCPKCAAMLDSPQLSLLEAS